MIQFKKILVPTDFSEPSKKAVTYGLTLATQSNARVITDRAAFRSLTVDFGTAWCWGSRSASPGFG